MLRSCDMVAPFPDNDVIGFLATLPLTMTSIPKAALYYYPGSIWSAVGNVLFIYIIFFSHRVQFGWHCEAQDPLVLITEYLLSYSEEKGYAPDEVDLRIVDLGSYETRPFYSFTKTYFS